MRKRTLFVIVAGAIILILLLSRPNFGFTPITGAESAGSDIAVAAIYGVIFWEMYKSIKSLRSDKESKTKQSEKNE